MQEITREKFEKAVNYAMTHLEVGPIKTVYDNIDAELERAGVTREQMLERAAQLKTSGQGLKANFEMAANDNTPGNELHLDALARVCETQQILQNAAKTFAVGLLKREREKEMWDDAVPGLRVANVVEKNVEAAPGFAMRVDRAHLRQSFIAVAKSLFEGPIPGLDIGIERFERTIHNAFREPGR